MFVTLNKVPTQFRLSPGVSLVLFNLSAPGKLVSVHYNHISIYFCLTGCLWHNDTEQPPQQQCHAVSLNTRSLLMSCFKNKTVQFMLHKNMQITLVLSVLDKL